MTTVVLLPGLDGTGILFSDFIAALGLSLKPLLFRSILELATHYLDGVESQGDFPGLIHGLGLLDYFESRGAELSVTRHIPVTPTESASVLLSL